MTNVNMVFKGEYINGINCRLHEYWSGKD